MKKLIAVALCVVGIYSANAWCGPGGWGYGPPPPCYGGWGGWGRGGCNFWPGFAGAAAGVIVGGAIANACAPRQTVVVQQPVVQPQVISQPVVVQQPVVVRPAYTSGTVIGTPSTATVIYR